MSPSAIRRTTTTTRDSGGSLPFIRKSTRRSQSAIETWLAFQAAAAAEGWLVNGHSRGRMALAYAQFGSRLMVVPAGTEEFERAAIRS